MWKAKPAAADREQVILRPHWCFSYQYLDFVGDHCVCLLDLLLAVVTWRLSYRPWCICLTVSVLLSRDSGLTGVQTTRHRRDGLTTAVHSCDESATGLNKETRSLTSCTDCVNEQPVWCADCFLIQMERSFTGKISPDDWREPTGERQAAESSLCPL